MDSLRLLMMFFPSHDHNICESGTPQICTACFENSSKILRYYTGVWATLADQSSCRCFLSPILTRSRQVGGEKHLSFELWGAAEVET